jgi:hypothetical protein
MKTTIRPAALRTMQFTPAEVRRIEKAATVSGYPGAGASWGRNMLLHDVSVILRSGAKAPRRKSDLT